MEYTMTAKKADSLMKSIARKEGVKLTFLGVDAHQLPFDGGAFLGQRAGGQGEDHSDGKNESDDFLHLGFLLHPAAAAACFVFSISVRLSQDNGYCLNWQISGVS